MDNKLKVTGKKKEAKGQFSDSLLDRLMTNNWDIKETIKDQILHGHTKLRADEYKEIDNAVIQKHRNKVTLLADMRAAGLVQSLGGLGTMFTEYENVSGMTDADVTMDGDTATERDEVDKGWVPTPVPLISKKFDLNLRKLEASRNRGDSLDTTNASEAAEKVTRKVDGMFFSSSFTYGGKSTQGLIDVVSENGTHTGDWDGTPGNIFDDINKMIADLFGNGFEGPYNLYMNPSQYDVFWGADAEGTGDMGSVQDRVEDHPLINKVDWSAGVPNKNAVLVQMSSDVIEFKEAETITTIDWESGSGFTRYWMVFLAGIPVIKKDSDGNYGTTYIADITS